MPKVRVELLNVTCRKTEDIGWLGSEDEFYIAGALSDTTNTQGVLTPILDIDNGETKPYANVVFDADVSSGQSIRGGLKAFDEDMAKDWEKIEANITTITDKVISELANSEDPRAATASQILEFAVKALGFLFSLDKDDELGSLELNIPASGPIVEEKDWNFNGDDSDYTVRYRITRDSPGPTTPTPAWAVMGDETISGVGVSSWKSEVMDLFVRGTDNQLYYKWYDSNNGGWKQGYEPLGGQISFSPVAVSGGSSDLIDVFARGIGSSDGVYHKIWQGGVWSDWQRLGSMDTLSGPGVSWEPTRNLDVFVRGTDNALYVHQYNPNNGWVGPWPLDGQISSSPAAIALVNGPVHVFARGMDNALWHKWYDGGWQNWESLGGPLGGQISSDPESGPSVSSWGPQRLDVFVRGTDNAVWHRWSTDGGVRWSDWESLGGVITSSPASISRAPNLVEVFARGTDNKLYHIWWDGVAWRP